MSRRDNSGYRSRKFAIVVLGMFLATGSFLVLDFFPAAAAQYVTFVSALMGLAGLYMGGNVAATHVLTKNGGKTDERPSPDQLDQSIKDQQT